LLLSMLLPAHVSVRVYRADSFQVRGPTTFFPTVFSSCSLVGSLATGW